MRNENCYQLFESFNCFSLVPTLPLNWFLTRSSSPKNSVFIAFNNALIGNWLNLWWNVIFLHKNEHGMHKSIILSIPKSMNFLFGKKLKKRGQKLSSFIIITVDNHILLWNIITDLDSSFSYVWEWHEIIRSSENREQSWSEFSCQIWIKWNNNQSCLKHLKGTKDDTHTAHTFKSLLEWFAELENRFPVSGAKLAKLQTCLMARLEYLQLLLQDQLKDIVLKLLTVSSFGDRASGWFFGCY